MPLHKPNHLLLLLISILWSHHSWTQQAVQLIPLEANSSIQNFIKKQKHNVFKTTLVCPSTTLGLPFFDDFANNPNGFYPDCNKWQDNQAFINQSMTYKPPTIGVATLDGLSSDGTPYNQFTSASLPADTLTSQAIDLSTYNSASNIILSYFYQPMGLCDIPEEEDSLVIEFLDRAGNWVLMKSHKSISDTATINTRISFQQSFIAVDDTIFLHNNFQFRFRNYASISGNNDHWHVDYVYMDINRTDTTATVFYADVAYTETPVSPFVDYTAIPWNHFSSSMWNLDVSMACYNHGNITGTLDRRYLVEDSSGLNLLTSQIPTTTYGSSPNVNDNYNANIIGNFNTFSPTAATQLKSTYIIDNPSDFQNYPMLARNDTAVRYTELSNYFAYDDGTAESRIVVVGRGTQIAVGYQTTVQDTLRGIYFHLPYFENRNAEQDFINIKVWADDGGTIGRELYSRDIYRLNYTDGFNGFCYVQLTDFAGTPTPIEIPAGTKFYVGWQQASAEEVPIGFDRSTDNRDKTFLKTGGNNWSNLTIEGTVMIRPLLSLDSDPPILPLKQIQNPALSTVNIYPNPSSDMITIECTSCSENAMNLCKIQVTNNLGQVIHFQNWSSQLEIKKLPPGIYSLNIYKHGQIIGQNRFVKAF